MEADAAPAATTLTPNRFDDPSSGGTSCSPPAPASACSLRGAVAAAQHGDTIQLGAGTYLLELGALQLPKSITISGAGPAATTIRQTGDGRVIKIENQAGLTMSGVTITGGHLVGGDGPEGQEPGEDGEDGGTASGGGIAAGGPVTLTDVVITENGAYGGDGGDGLDNEEARGGDGGVGGFASGGGISGGNPLVLIRVAVTNNVAQPGAGGDGGEATWSGYGGFGGAGGSATGGGISLGNGALVADDSLIAGNEARASTGGNGGVSGPLAGWGGAGGEGDGAMGGGLYSNGSVRLTNVTVSGNAALGGSGGDAGTSTGVIRGRDGAVGHGGLGGAVALFDGAVGQLASVTLASNRVTPGAGGEGGEGGLSEGGTNEEPGAPGTAVPPAGGNAFISSASLTIRDAVLATGQAPAGTENCGHERGGTLTSAGHNLQDLYQCFTSSPAASDQFGTPPGLGPLQDNGGATETMALSDGSAAIDAGEPDCVDAFGQPLAADQRGEARLSPCDVGAFEFQPPPLQSGGTAKPSAPAKLTRLRVSPSNLQNGQRATISFTLSAEAMVKFSLTRKVRGLKIGARCARGKRKDLRGRRCGRLVKVGGAPRAISAGAGLTERTWKPHHLLPGSYRLSATPAGGPSQATSFTVRK
jgi:hypothetical protein